LFASTKNKWKINKSSKTHLLFVGFGSMYPASDYFFLTGVKQIKNNEACMSDALSHCSRAWRVPIRVYKIDKIKPDFTVFDKISSIQF
jgi:hypothetical protein